MNWITNLVRPKIRSLLRRETPENLWIKCPETGQLVFYKDVEANQFVIPSSNYHMRISATARLKMLFDGATWLDIGVPEVSVDPLKFRDERRYADRLKDAKTKTGLNDAVKLGLGKLDGLPVTIGVQDFDFMGGSLGMAAGEAVVRGLETAVQKSTPFIMFAASGGARMQEGILSLMQLPRTTAAVQMLREARLPYIVVLTNPTTGGVTASYAMLGDVQIAEPGALIGFAGPRVIEQTIREKLPEGFQRAEYLSEHGMVDMVVHRHKLRSTLADLCRLLTKAPAPARSRSCRSRRTRERAAMTQPVDAIVARLAALHPKRIDLSLERVERLLATLGHPERGLPPVIHVAGTNGKGSTIAFMRAILEAAGKRVHVYSSPHLVRFNERYRLNGSLVSDDELGVTLEECERANAGAPITVFEITTAVGMMLFSRHPADVLLLEVGLGGRLDATNVIEHPLAAVITRIAIDHADFLGDTLEKIAHEKAGILKRNAPAVIAAQARDALAAIERQAARVNAPLKVAGEDWTATEERGRLVYQDEAGLLDLPAPKLYGRHQFENAGLAIATLRNIKPLKIASAAYDAGMVKADWPARLQRLSSGRLVDLAPAGSELWLDGGHNPDGGRAVAAALADLEERVSRPLVLIVGMLATKDCVGFLGNFTGLARRAIAVPVQGAEKGLTAEAVAGIARSIGLPATSRDNLQEALEAARKLDLDPPPRILITGSLYLAGDVLRENDTLPA